MTALRKGDRQLENRKWVALTARDREVLLMLADSKSNKMTARRIGMSEITARNLIVSIFERLGRGSTPPAAAFAIRSPGRTAADDLRQWLRPPAPVTTIMSSRAR